MISKRLHEFTVVTLFIIFIKPFLYYYRNNTQETMVYTELYHGFKLQTTKVNLEWLLHLTTVKFCIYHSLVCVVSIFYHYKIFSHYKFDNKTILLQLYHPEHPTCIQEFYNSSKPIRFTDIAGLW